MNERYHTPNMERLAGEGKMFTQAYASSVSSPTRVSLTTGMNASRHRVTNWTLQKNTSTDRKSEVLEFPAHNNGQWAGIGPTCTIRSQDWKLIYYYETGEKKLFNISEDIGERNNIAEQNPNITKKTIR